MKRLFLGFVMLVVLLVVGGFFALTFLLGSLVKKGVETAGPLITKVNVKLDSATLRPLSGGGQLNGLVIGNPEGFKSPSAIQVGSMEVEVVPRSVFADKVIIHSIKVQAPEITFEGGLHGNNLSKLLDNVRGTTSKPGASSSKQSSSASRKLQVDDFLITGGKVNLSIGLLGGTATSLPLPDIHLTGLGQGSEGITAAELSERLLNAIIENTTKAMAGSVPNGLGNVEGLKTGAVQQVEKAMKGLGGLLHPK